jgi:hypothetical protein
MRLNVRAFAAVLGALTIGACSHLPQLPSITGDAPAAPATPRDNVRNAIELLGQGDEWRARAELRAALNAQPNNVTAQRLMQQLESDPRTLLTGAPRPYIVRPGETMSQIAERYIGDGLMFYALARYNGIDAPNQLAAGQQIMIPRRPGVAVQETAANEVAPPLEPPVASGAATPPRSGEASRANALRLQALQQLNTGRVDSAVTLLRQAQSLDANNPAIQRDLARAVRLQASLRSRGG